MSVVEPFVPLTPEELDWLDRLLYERVEEETADEEAEGILSLAELDGFFTALISGPLPPQDVDWWPLIWGDFEPEWESEAQFNDAMQLIQRHINTIAATLADAPEEFEPLFMEYEEDGELLLSVDDWCEGYMRGVALAEKRWKAAGEGLHKLLTAISAFSSVTDWRAHNRSSDQEFDQLSAALTPNVRRIYLYWHNADQATASPGK
ncbi:MAG TPA: UPF0149 family protein [Hyphomicrobiales bacterium]|nr:UPF0149 family protein [Hyphomicrobiales bacterium]